MDFSAVSAAALLGACPAVAAALPGANMVAATVPVKDCSFLFLQGDVEVEFIASKNPKELTALLEQISGSDELRRDYEKLEEQKDRAEEESALVYQEKRMIVMERKQKKAEKEEAERHLSLQKDLTKHFLWQLYTIEKDLKKMKAELAEDRKSLQLVQEENRFADCELTAKKKEQSAFLKKMTLCEKSIAKKNLEINENKTELLKLGEKISRNKSKIKSCKKELGKKDDYIKDLEKMKRLQSCLVDDTRFIEELNEQGQDKSGKLQLADDPRQEYHKMLEYDQKRDLQAPFVKLKETEESLEKELKGLQERESSAKAEAEQILTQIDELRAECEDWRSKLDECEKAIDELKEQNVSVTSTCTKLHHQVKEKEGQLGQLISRQQEIHEKCELEKLKLPTVNDPVDTGSSLQEPVLDYSQLSKIYLQDMRPSEHEFKEKTSALVAEIERTAPNIKALDQYDALQRKEKDVTEKLETAKKEEREISDRYNSVKKMRYKLFMEAFNHISKAIDKNYKQVTKSCTHPLGGTAYLNLENEDEPFLHGIKYTVMPPTNKNFRDMEQLSGGEKIVAAKALIFAIRSFSLDEVDAARNNLNVAKVAGFIRSKSCDLVAADTSALLGTDLVAADPSALPGADLVAADASLMVTIKCRAKWEEEEEEILCSIFAEKIEKGQISAGIWPSENIEEIRERFLSRSGKNFSSNQLKNKWNNLKQDYQRRKNIAKEEIDGRVSKEKKKKDFFDKLKERKYVLCFESLQKIFDEDSRDGMESDIVTTDQNSSTLQELQKLRQEIKEKEAALDEAEAFRKKMHNMFMELKGNARVFCRVRPLCIEGNTEVLEASIKYPISWKDAGRGIDLMYQGCAHSFKFDKVFNEKASQEDVFLEMSDFVQSCIDGYSVCIFNYGQTGSGKTYTMIGKTKVEGMLPRAVRQIFEGIRLRECRGWKYNIKVSILELYNERILDLLNIRNNQDFKIIHNSNGDPVVPGLTEVQVFKAEDVIEILEKASNARTARKTKMNVESSRSHFVFKLTISGNNEETRQDASGILRMIDLAGSESATRLGATGVMLEETKSINISLLALKNVFTAIGRKDPHIPYRDSRLTFLLERCLVEDCKVLMFVNISSEHSNLEETINSLKFASKVNACKINKQAHKTQSMRMHEDALTAFPSTRHKIVSRSALKPKLTAMKTPPRSRVMHVPGSCVRLQGSCLRQME